MNRQAATPPLPFSSSSSTEAPADAEPAISTDADQLRAIPRRLQNPTESRLQCWVIVNSTSAVSLCFPVLQLQPGFPRLDHSPVPRFPFHGSTDPPRTLPQSHGLPCGFAPRSLLSSFALPGNSHGPSNASTPHFPRSQSMTRLIRQFPVFVVLSTIIKSPTGFVFASRHPLGCLGRSCGSFHRPSFPRHHSCI